MIPLLTVKALRLLLVLPVLIVVIALVPAILVFPLLSDRQGGRVLSLVAQVRAWHADVAGGLDPAERDEVKELPW